MKPLNYKHETNLALKFLIIFFAFIVVSMILSCGVQKSTGQKYAVRKIEHVSGNRHILTTDSFKVVRHVRGIGRYKRDSVTKKYLYNE